MHTPGICVPLQVSSGLYGTEPNVPPCTYRRAAVSALATADQASQSLESAHHSISQLLYALSDASATAAASDAAAVATVVATTTAKRYTGWFSTLADYLETVLNYLQASSLPLNRTAGCIITNLQHSAQDGFLASCRSASTAAVVDTAYINAAIGVFELFVKSNYRLLSAAAVWVGQGACALQLWLVHHTAHNLGQDSHLPHH